jgi:hypothetical protein
VSEHDPNNCHDGAGCKPCKVAEAKLKLRALAATKKITPEDKARALAGLKEKARGLIGALLLAVSLVGCVAPEAIEKIRVEAAACHGLAVEPGNSAEVRKIGARQSLTFRGLHRALDGDDVPGAEAWPAIPPEFLPAEPPR